MSMNNFPYKTFRGWVRSLGLKMSDLTTEELESAKQEFEDRKKGYAIMDGLEADADMIKLRVQYRANHEGQE